MQAKGLAVVASQSSALSSVGSQVANQYASQLGPPTKPEGVDPYTSDFEQSEPMGSPYKSSSFISSLFSFIIMVLIFGCCCAISCSPCISACTCSDKFSKTLGCGGTFDTCKKCGKIS
jgi:hypothetical protein